MNPKQFDTKQLTEMVKVRFAPPEYGCFFNVANGTGYDYKTRRYADGLAMSIWPSRGLLLHGIEIKASRADWLKELKSPAKAESICVFCDRWWVVAATGCVEKSELPQTWGLMEPSGRGGLKVIVDAPALSPIPMTREMLAAIYRRAVEQSADAELLEKTRNAGFDEGCKHAEQIHRQESKRYADLKSVVSDFEAASGVEIRNRWDHDSKEIGAALKMVLEGKHTPGLDDLRRVKKIADSILEEISPFLSAHPEEQTA